MISCSVPGQLSLRRKPRSAEWSLFVQHFWKVLRGVVLIFFSLFLGFFFFFPSPVSGAGAVVSLWEGRAKGLEPALSRLGDAV